MTETAKLFLRRLCEVARTIVEGEEMAANYWVRNGSEIIGPMSQRELLDTAKQGLIGDLTRIRKGDNGTWHLASRIDGISELIQRDTQLSEQIQPPGELVNGNNPTELIHTRQKTISMPRSQIIQIGFVACLLLVTGVAISFLTGTRGSNETASSPTLSSKEAGYNEEKNHKEVVGGESQSVGGFQNRKAENSSGESKQGATAIDKELGLPELIAKIENAVVRIDIKTLADERVGSGFIAERNGVIITNEHVIRDAIEATAVFSDGRRLPVVSVLKCDESRDIAVLKLSKDPLISPLTLSRQHPQKGEQLVVFGAPKGLSFSASEGIVAAIRDSDELRSFGVRGSGKWIQSTAPVSPGNSGGPVCNRSGAVVAITTWGAVNAQNLNLAISSIDVLDVLEDAKKTTPVELNAQETEVERTDDQSPATLKVAVRKVYAHPYAVVEIYDDFEKSLTLQVEFNGTKEASRSGDRVTFILSAPFISRSDRRPKLESASFYISAVNWSARLIRIETAGAIEAVFKVADERPKVNVALVSDRADFTFHALRLPWRLLREISYADNSAFRIGQFEYSFTETEKEAFREFLSRIAPGDALDGKLRIEGMKFENEPIPLETRREVVSREAEAARNKALAVTREKAEAEARRRASDPAVIEAERKRKESELREQKEKRAESKLSLAKALISSGKREQGRSWIAEIVRDFPGTKAADEANTLLGNPKKKASAGAAATSSRSAVISDNKRESDRRTNSRNESQSVMSADPATSEIVASTSAKSAEPSSRTPATPSDGGVNAIGEPSFKAVERQAALAASDGHEVLVKNSLLMEFVFIPHGEFVMGSSANEPGRNGDEVIHKVSLTRSFHLSANEVTQEAFELVMKANPSYFKSAKNPVEQVTWDEAKEFCKRLSDLPDEKSAGRSYRLPTEAEWEYACRAGSSTAFSFGNNESELPEFGWFAKNAEKRAHEVRQRRPNAWGLFDMHGNVWEWCEDRYGPLSSTASVDPKGAEVGESRVIRGGTWLDGEANARSARRGGYTPTARSNLFGFRVLLVNDLIR